MKYLLIIILTFSLNHIIYCQGEEEQYPDNEFTIQIQNAENRIIVFEFIPLGANWSKSTECNISLYNDYTTYSSSLDGGNPGYVDCAFNGLEYRFWNEGNYTLVGDCAQSTAGLKPLRNGFYRINIKEDNVLKTYAYFDWRDLGFPTLCNTCPYGNDFTIRYDADYEYIMFWNDHNIYISDQNPDLYLTNGQIITWADWKCNERVFSSFWSNGLVLAPDESNHPRIVWGPYQATGITVQQYKVYRKYGSSAWEYFTSVSSSTYEYTDQSVYLSIPGGQAGTDVQYKVTAVYNTNSETSPTNIVTVNVQESELEKKGNSLTNIKSYILDQNFPNPFNPSTKISYSIKEEGLVTLKVYDILGKEIATLVNENKPAGIYEADFNASQLPSGMYIYKLQAGSFSDVKKMLLTK